ncbi:MAG: gamma-glutamyl-gamma-aminobutyrate hydrolase family protein [Planctomycetota bacterium]|jgi:GMP synthase-like glutamine amidotransferase|nr:gamma-glutamyl-gamma-aminobutyrate hydrolase family protein [Planctomycetota bacterium]
MDIVCCRHVPFEGPAGIADWVAARGHRLTEHCLWQEPVPALADALVVMGGPMGVADEAEYPWLAPERALIQAAIAAAQPVLGICLGAQQIAAALGAAVARNPVLEIGWFATERVASDEPLAQAVSARFTALHWHGDTFALPAGARQLWRSAACEQQGFVYAERTLALQFHLEADAAAVAGLIEHGGDDLSPQSWVQDPDGLRMGASAHAEAARAELFALLDTWVGPRS